MQVQNIFPPVRHESCVNPDELSSFSYEVYPEMWQGKKYGNYTVI